MENTHTVLYDSDDPENQVQWSRVTLGDADEKLPYTPAAASYSWRPWSKKRSREPSPNMETAPPPQQQQQQSRARRLSASRNLSNAMGEGVSDLNELVQGLVF